MSRKNSEIQGQTSIFDQPPEEELGVAEIPETPVKITHSKGGRWREGGPMDLAAQSGSEAIAAIPREQYGVYNDVNERAVHLITALKTISSQNSLGGFTYKGNKDLDEADTSKVPSPIWERYGEDTPFRLDNAEAKKDREQYVPRREFERAIGLTALQKAERQGKRPVMTASAINDYASRYHRKFVEEFGGVKDVAEHRRAYTKKLERGLAKRSSASEIKAA